MSKPVKRARQKPLFVTRTMPIRMDADGRPKSLDEKTRSVEVVASTEEPALVWDWDTFNTVPEILLMTGCHWPATNRVTLLDTHDRSSVVKILGSFRGPRIDENGETGPELVGRCHYSTVPEADSAYTKVVEGHLTDVSVGYEINAYTWIEEGKTATVEGREFTGPLRVVTDWTLKELSACPIGADDKAKFRNQQSAHNAAGQNQEENAMSTKASKAAAKSAKSSGGKTKAAPKSVPARRKARSEDGGEEELDGDGNPIQRNEDGEEVDEDGNPIQRNEDGEEVDEDGNPIEREEGEEDETREGEEEQAEERKGKRSKLGKLSATRAERSRVLEIQNMCRSFNVPADLEKQFVERGTTMNAARAKVMQMLQNDKPGGPGVRVSSGTTEAEKFRSAAADSLMLRVGLAVAKPAPGAENLQGLMLRELAKECLIRSGQRATGDIRDIVGRALTSTDLPMLLEDTSRRILVQYYEQAEETWQAWCGIGSVPDFKINTAVTLEAGFKLKKIPQHGEYTRGVVAEMAEKYAIATYGEMFTIGRQALINDDLNALSEAPREYGEACSRLIGDIAYESVTDNPKMGDGTPLFHAKHGNLYTGKGGIPNVQNIGAVRTGMKQQEDSFGNKRPVNPLFFMAPAGMETECDVFFNTQLAGAGSIIGTGDQPLVHNPFGGSRFTRVHEHRLDDHDPDAWFLAGAKGSAVTVFFLNGVTAPYMETQNGWNTDGVEIKVRMDAGAKAMRSRTIAKATK